MNPEDHRDAAMQLLADINDGLCDHHEALILAQAATAHALLGLLEVQIAKSAPEIDHIVRLLHNRPTRGDLR